MTISAITYKLGREDLSSYDGKSTTYTRNTTTRGKLTLHKIGKNVDVLQVYGDYDQYNSATLNSAISAVGGNNVCLEIDTGDWDITENVTFQATAIPKIYPGAKLKIATGVTVTMPMPQVECIHWIELSGTGKVVFTSGELVWADWYGVNTTPGTTECSR